MPLPEREEEPRKPGNARPADGARPAEGVRPDGAPTDDDLRAALPHGWLQALRGAAEDLEPPARLRGRYDRRLQLGRGGMGGVWRYFDTHTRRDVAVKFAYEGRGDALHEEVEVLAQLDHPSIPRALDAGDDGGVAFAVFPLIEGPTLHAMIAARRTSTASLYEEFGATRPSDRPSPQGVTPSTRSAWPVRPADRITQPTVDDDSPPAPPSKAEAARLLSAFRDLTTALGAMHRRGLLHIDIKPANIMLGPDGRGYLIDFGLASGSDGGEGDEDGGAHGGTPQYMSPEQASGVGGLDFRSDIYSLGVSFHEGLTGVRVVRPPSGLGNRARSDWIKSAVITTPVPKLATVAPGLRDILGKDTTAALEAVLDKACRKNPAERYATAEALDADLARAAAGREPERAVAPRFVIRRRLTIAAAATITLCTAAFALRSWHDAVQRQNTVAVVAAELEAAKADGATRGDLVRVWEAIADRRTIIAGEGPLSERWRTYVELTAEAFAAEAILGQSLTIYDAGARLAPSARVTTPRHLRYAAAAANLRDFGGGGPAFDLVEAFAAYIDVRYADVDRLVERSERATGDLAILRSTLIVCAEYPRLDRNSPRFAVFNHHRDRLKVTAETFDPDALADLPLACAAFVQAAGISAPGVKLDEGRLHAIERRLLVRIAQMEASQTEERRTPADRRTTPLRPDVMRSLAARLAFAQGRFADTVDLLDSTLEFELSPDNAAAIRILRGVAALRLSCDPQATPESRAVASDRWVTDLAEGLAAAPFALSSAIALLFAVPYGFEAGVDANAESKTRSTLSLALLENILFGKRLKWPGELSRLESSSPNVAILANAVLYGSDHADTSLWTRLMTCFLAYARTGERSSEELAGLDVLHPANWSYSMVDHALQIGDPQAALEFALAAKSAGIGLPAFNDAAHGRALVARAETAGLSPSARNEDLKEAAALLNSALDGPGGLRAIAARIRAFRDALPANDPRGTTAEAHLAFVNGIIDAEAGPALKKAVQRGP